MFRAVAKQMFVRCGAPGLVRAFRGLHLRILMYHRFSGYHDLDRALSRQIQHLRRYYHPVSMRQIGEALSGGRKLPERALALTVDDGYADFAGAWPVFRRFDFPVTLFVVSGFVDRTTWLWPDVVHFCCQMSPLTRLELALPHGRSFAQTLSCPADRELADRRLDQILIALPDSERRRFVAELPRVAGVALPAEIPDHYAPLSWDQLKGMSGEGLEVGAHTVDHPILARIDDAAALRKEIRGSKERIEAALGRPVTHFCYPNGQEDDYNAATRAAVREAGFSTAVNAIRGLNRAGCDAIDLHRVGVDPSTPHETFQMEVAGFRVP